jgi:hypothetical protein
MRRLGRAPPILIVAILGGCASVPRTGMADRCADFMTAADPAAAIHVIKREAAVKSLTTIVAEVVGARSDLPPNTPLPRFLAVECRFENGVLTGFRWTKGPG